jgi:hypothetical protein
MSNHSIGQLILAVRESLEREIHSFCDEIRTRFDTQAARLERHAALLQTGSRWTNRMNERAEKVDTALETKDRCETALTGSKAASINPVKEDQ